MPSYSMDDGGWGQIASGLAEAMVPDPLKKAHMMVLSEQYKKLLQQRQAGAGSVDAYNALTQADPNFEMSPGVSGASPEGIPLAPQEIATVEARRNLARKNYAATVAHAANAQDFAKGVYGAMGQNTVMPGIPLDKSVRDVAETQLSGIGVTMPGYDETKQQPKNIVQLDETGKPIPGTQRAVSSIPQVPGQNYALTGPVDMNRKGLADEGHRLDILGNAASSLATSGPGSLTLPQLREAELALATQYPTSQKIEPNPRGGRDVVGYEEKAIPRQFAPLVAHINERLYGAAPAATTAPAPTAAPVPFPNAIPGAGSLSVPDALAAQPATVPPTAPGAAAGPAAAATPIVPAGALPPPQAAPAQRFAGAPGSLSVTPLPGASGPSTHETATTVAQVARAQEARLKLQQKIGYDEQTGTLPQKFYVPGVLPTAIGELFGGSATGRGLVKKIDPAAQEYRAEAMRWIEPVLRAASGAAIRPEEYSDYIAMFIPETGDSRQEVMRKIEAMKNWESITARASTAREALSMMDQIAAQTGDTATRQAADRIRVRAAGANTLDTPLPKETQAAPAGRVTDHNAVEELLRRQGLR